MWKTAIFEPVRYLFAIEKLLANTRNHLRNVDK